jgi:glycosyltransferase involved in cell wall biosynthesis
MHWMAANAYTIALMLDWLLALGWTTATWIALRNMPRVPNLLDAAYQLKMPQTQGPALTVIVPARNEGAAIEATLRSLLETEGVNVEIIAVNDRSSDDTAAIMDRLAEEGQKTGRDIRVIHVESLPTGWMGKTHAMALAARQSSAPWILFTDGDVIFRRDALARAMQFVTVTAADHLVLFPTMILHGFGERMMIGFFQSASLIAARPWRVADPKTKDYIGMGAFNMIRREVYQKIGGYEALRMEVVDDLRLGFEVKRRGFRQQAAFAPGLIRIRWAEGAAGIIGNLTKNCFAIFRFRMLLLLLVCVGVAFTCLFPFVVLPAGRGMWFPSGIVVVMLLLVYKFYDRRGSGIGTAYAFTFPVAAVLSIYALLRSMVLTLVRGGVDWRGTRYPLHELRKRGGPLW